MLFVFMAVACENDGGDSVRETTEGTVPNIRKIAETDQGLNLLALNNGEDIDLGLTVDDVEGFGEFTSLDIIGFYTKNGVVERAVLKANITQFPTTLHFNQNDLYAAFTAINSAADIDILDKLLITAEVKQKDGTVLKLYSDKGAQLFGADIANSEIFKVSQTYIVSCPLDDASLFSGDYKVITDQWSDYTAGKIIPLVYNPADGTFTFRILATQNPYISNKSTAYLKVTVNPATFAATVQSNEDFDYGGGDTTPVTGSGSISSCSGDISLKLNFLGFGPGYAGYNFVLEKVN